MERSQIMEGLVVEGRRAKETTVFHKSLRKPWTDFKPGIDRIKVAF